MYSEQLRREIDHLCIALAARDGVAVRERVPTIIELLNEVNARCGADSSGLPVGPCDHCDRTGELRHDHIGKMHLCGECTSDLVRVG